MGVTRVILGVKRRRQRRNDLIGLGSDCGQLLTKEKTSDRVSPKEVQEEMLGSIVTNNSHIKFT